MFNLDFDYLSSLLTEIYNEYPNRQLVTDNTAKFLGRFPKSDNKFPSLRARAEQITKVAPHEIRSLVSEISHTLTEMKNYDPTSAYFYVGYKVVGHENGQDEWEIFKTETPELAIEMETSAKSEIKPDEHNTSIQIRYESGLLENPYLK